MTIAQLPPIEKVRLFNRKEYYKMFRAGLFRDRRVELYDGVIVEMSPQDDPHALTIAILTEWLVSQLLGKYTIRCQLPLVVSEMTELEPDFAIVPGTAADQTGHPATAPLVIEVSHTTVSYDRRKGNGFASAQVPEYWIVNLRQRHIEVYSNPIADPGVKFGHCYQQKRVVTQDQSIKALHVPLRAEKVSRLFPAALREL